MSKHMTNRLLGISVSVLLLSVALIASLLVSPIALAYNTHSIDFESSSSQYLSISDASQTGLDITGDLTIEAWVKLETSTEEYFVSKFGLSNNMSYRLGYDGTGNIVLNITSNGTGSTINNLYRPYTLGTGTWHHIAVSWTAATSVATFYVDGASIGTATGNISSIHNGNAPFMIGSYDAFYPTQSTDGLVDDVRVWNIVRTATQISDDMDTELNGNESGLAGYWKLNNSLADTSVNGNTLTNNGTALFSTDWPFGGFAADLSNRKTSDEFVSNSTIVQDDNNLTLALDANKTYVIDGVIFASSTSATPDIKIAFMGQTGSVIRIGYTNDVNEMVLNSGEESARISLPANTPTSVHVKGTVVTSAAGDFKLKWAQVTSSGSATAVLTGSYLRAQEI
ncbi:MAG: RTX toxins and related Ca2+-binding domain [Parcubacteria group bacterium Athens0416_74]|nr:MAG: RTX toxins and related Ca2+-binding domain [Parcubacteria group bacterium Athens0416_74]